MLEDFLPLFLMILMAAGLAVTLLKASEWIGPKRPNLSKTSTYESGMDPIGTARERYSVKFYLVAMIFIIFDIEVVFLYPWAVSFRDFVSEGIGLGVTGVVAFFILVLVVGLIYDIKKGGLEFYN
jgi:NADH-quinone oxidoreductase subunit A